jgi:hypothetical protein
MILALAAVALFLMADAGKREDYPKRPVPTLDPSIVIVQQPAPEGTP